MKISSGKLVLLIMGVHLHLGLLHGAREPLRDMSLKSYSGEYWFNATCTDEAAIVKITFRKAAEDETSGERGWLADGSMDSGARGTTVEFRSAFVDVDGQGVITVSAQFFGFSIRGKTLTWLPNYDRTLYKDGNEKAAAKAEEEIEQRKTKARK
jgi:hypothetical protein